VILVDPSYARGQRSEYNYGQIPLIGQITLTPYSIATNNLIVSSGLEKGYWLPHVALILKIAAIRLGSQPVGLRVISCGLLAGGSSRWQAKKISTICADLFA
jgi:hypothetical protein